MISATGDACHPYTLGALEKTAKEKKYGKKEKFIGLNILQHGLRRRLANANVIQDE